MDSEWNKYLDDVQSVIEDDDYNSEIAELQIDAMLMDQDDSFGDVMPTSDLFESPEEDLPVAAKDHLQPPEVMEGGHLDPYGVLGDELRESVDLFLNDFEKTPKVQNEDVGTSTVLIKVDEVLGNGSLSSSAPTLNPDDIATHKVEAAALPLPIVEQLLPTIRVSSITCHYNMRLKQKLVLKVLARKMWNSEFKSGGKGIVKGFKNPYGTAMIYSSGKVTLFGHTTTHEAQQNARRLRRHLAICGYKTQIHDFSTSQVSGEAMFPKGINFDACGANPDMRKVFIFPMEGENFVIIKLGTAENENIIGKCCRNGRAQIMAARTVHQMMTAFNTLCSLLDGVQRDIDRKEQV